LIGPIQTFCRSGDESIKADLNAKPNSPEWNKWQCENAKAIREDNERALKKLREEDR
jgi:hypothetical protein